MIIFKNILHLCCHKWFDAGEHVDFILCKGSYHGSLMIKIAAICMPAKSNQSKKIQLKDHFKIGISMPKGIYIFGGG